MVGIIALAGLRQTVFKLNIARIAVFYLNDSKEIFAPDADGNALKLFRAAFFTLLLAI